MTVRVDNELGLNLRELELQGGETVCLGYGDTFTIGGPYDPGMDGGSGGYPLDESRHGRYGPWLMGSHVPTWVERPGQDPPEPRWEEIEPTRVSNLSPPLGVGDEWRSSGGDVFRVLENLESDDPRTLRVWRTWADGSEAARSVSPRLRTAHAVRRLVSAPGSSMPRPAAPPKVTEVVCSSCGRLLGDFSDGSTPRTVLGACCAGPKDLWRRNDAGLYTGENRASREDLPPDPDEEPGDYDYDDPGEEEEY